MTLERFLTCPSSINSPNNLTLFFSNHFFFFPLSFYFSPLFHSSVFYCLLSLKDLKMENIEDKFPPNSPMKTHKIFLGVQFCSRILVIGTTLAATWLTLTNKQSIRIGDFVMDARYSYSSAFKFFAFANIVVCAFSVLSLLFLFIFSRHGSNPTHFFFMFLHDLFMMCLVLAGCSAATAVGFLGKNGNKHSGWMPICDHFGRFCNRGTISVILSYMAMVFLLILTVTSASKSRKIQM